MSLANDEVMPDLPAPAVARASRFTFDPERIMALLRRRIIGQNTALEAIEAMLQVVKADIGEGERPLSVQLLMGPTGVGKTELVKLLAEGILGSRDGLCRIDMSTLAQEHYAAALTGAPPGYVGSKEGVTLFDVDAIQGSFSRPGVVLFDELEKASREVYLSLLNVMESGQLTLSAGSHRIDFRNTLIFMTSNIGAEAASAYHERFRHGWRRWLRRSPQDESALLDEALRQRFPPEFLNRIDRVLTFERLQSGEVDTLLDIQLEKLNARLGRRGLTLEIDTEVRGHLCREHDVRYGARGLARRMRVELEPALARVMLANPGDFSFRARLEQGVILISPA